MCALEKYNEKRDFKQTAEPKGEVKKGSPTLRFVIQRHAASHLHYDFRLEMEGVLKSWAIPKGPSLYPHDKRLAMMVEDHPFDYRTFEGSIPEGNYGAGEVEIWDEGTYNSLNAKEDENEEKVLLGELKSGSLKFILKGKKLKGEFALVKIKNSEQDNAWLLIKHNDKYATENEYDAEEHVKNNSKVSNYLENKDSKKKVVAKSPKKK